MGGGDLSAEMVDRVVLPVLEARAGVPSPLQPQVPRGGHPGVLCADRRTAVEPVVGVFGRPARIPADLFLSAGMGRGGRGDRRPGPPAAREKTLVGIDARESLIRRAP